MPKHKTKPSDYRKMTPEDFDRILADIVNESSSYALLSIPGVYEIVSEHFNNGVLESWEAEQETNADMENSNA